MKIFSSFFYTIGQGFRNLFRNKLYTLASIATISACLFMVGILYSVVANMENMVKTAEEGVCVTVFFEDGTDYETMERIGQKIASRVEVDHIEFTDADQAWEEWKATYPPEYSEGFTENPLADSSNYKVYLSDVSMQSSLVTYLESLPQVRKVNHSELTADMLTGVNSLIGYISLGLIAVLLAVSVFLISNTVNHGITVRKDAIEVMKYIGATDFFVRAPFVVECMMIGALGAVVPLVVLRYAYSTAVSYIADRFSVLSTFLVFLPISEIFRVLIPTSFILGVGIGLFGSIITVRKHLHV